MIATHIVEEELAGMSVSLDGNNIQLSFQKDHQSTSVVLDVEAARSLIGALGQLLDVIEEQDDDEHDDDGAEQTSFEIGEEGEDGEEGDELEELIDITSPSIDIGLDEDGHAILTLQAGIFAPMLIRLQDDEARHIARGLLEILNSPQDIRQSGGGH